MIRIAVTKLGGAVLLLGLSTTSVRAEAVDCQAARCTIQAEIDAECPCEEARNHGRYLTCVVRVVNRAVREDRIPTSCRNAINGCYIRSLCGKREATVLCDLPGDGPSGRCRPLLSDDHCVARGGEVVSTCCDVCDATTPTPSATAPTPTPSGGTPATTGTPSPSGGTPGPTTGTPGPTTGTPVPTSGTPVPTSGTPVPTGTTSSAIPATPTPSGVAATPTTGATAATAVPTASGTGATSTPDVVATPTTGATASVPGATTTLALPSATPPATSTVTTGSPTPVPTAGGFLFVSVDAEPDDGAPPLTVQWTSDVSGGTPPYSYRWDFGDGSAADTTASPTHVYERTGDFTATLTVTDAVGAMESDDWDVTVERP